MLPVLPSCNSSYCWMSLGHFLLTKNWNSKYIPSTQLSLISIMFKIYTILHYKTTSVFKKIIYNKKKLWGLLENFLRFTRAFMLQIFISMNKSFKLCCILLKIIIISFVKESSLQNKFATGISCCNVKSIDWHK